MIRTRPFHYFTKTRRVASLLAAAASFLSSAAYADLSFTPLTISNAREAQSNGSPQVRLSFQSNQTELSAYQQKNLSELLLQGQITELQQQQAQQQRRLVITIAVWPDQTIGQQQSNATQAQIVERRLQIIKQYLTSQNSNLSFDGEYNMASQTSDLWNVERNAGRPSEALVIVRFD